MKICDVSERSLASLARIIMYIIQVTVFEKGKCELGLTRLNHGSSYMHRNLSQTDIKIYIARVSLC